MERLWPLRSRSDATGHGRYGPIIGVID